MTYFQPMGHPVPLVQTQVVAPPYRCSTAHVVVAWVLAVLTGLYLLPWAVAATRNRSNVAAVALVNLFLGWTLIGWVVALVMACGSERPVVVVQHLYAPQPAWNPQPAWTPPPTPWVDPAAQATPVAPVAQVEPTRVDLLGSEATRPIARSPWEPDHRR